MRVEYINRDVEPLRGVVYITRAEFSALNRQLSRSLLSETAIVDLGGVWAIAFRGLLFVDIEIC